MPLDANHPSERLGRLLVELADELRPLVTQLLASAAYDAVARDGRQLPAPESDPWLTADEAAQRVGVHRRTVYRALAAGALNGGQIETGNGACRWRIRASEVDRWVGARQERFEAPLRPARPVRAPAGPTGRQSSYRTRVRRTET